jgi:general stress protein 26
MADDAQRVWDLVEKIGFCMLATRDGEDIRSRPMAAYPDRDGRVIHFLTDADSWKDEEIERNPNVGLAFADTDAQTYVSLTGMASVYNDRGKIHELWSAPAKAWWDGPDDPSIRLLTVRPKDAQYWDSPGTVVSYIKMLAAAVTDAKPALGDNAKVQL